MPGPVLRPGPGRRLDDRPVPAPALDQPGLLQLLVGPGDSAAGQAQVGRELANRGQPLAGQQAAGRDQPGDLLAQLLIGRGRRVQVDLKRGCGLGAPRGGGAHAIFEAWKDGGSGGFGPAGTSAGSGGGTRFHQPSTHHTSTAATARAAAHDSRIGEAV